MKYKSLLILAVLITAALLSCKGKDSDAPKEEKNFDKDASYALGMSMAADMSGWLAGNGVVPDWDEYLKGIREQLSGKKTRFDKEEAIEIVNRNFEAMMEKREAEYLSMMEELGAEEKQAGIDFLTENSKKPGVKATASGLQYEVIKEGNDSRKPTADDFVRVHYTGTLINGTVFDSSVNRGEPIEFPLSGVISGWTEGLQLMRVGSKYKFYIPQELGYGARGQGQIPPFAALIFEVELLDILNY